MFGLIDSLGGGELLAVLIMMMVVVGPDRLPMVARKIGKGIAQARAQIASMSDEVREVVDDPAMQPLREIGEFAMRPRQKLSEIVRMAELDLTEEKAALEAAGTAASGEPADAGGAAEPEDPSPAEPVGPLHLDDKLGDRRPPVDVEVAAAAAAEAERRAAEEEQTPAPAPDHVAFTTRAAPLGVEPDTPARPAAFGTRGRSLSDADS